MDTKLLYLGGKRKKARKTSFHPTNPNADYLEIRILNRESGIMWFPTAEG
jgi:hypothetical protein